MFAPKQRATDAEVDALERALIRASNDGYVCEDRKPRDHVLFCFRGTGTPISEKWNVLVYAGADNHAVVCVDFALLNRLACGDYPTVSALPVISIDDAGWGFPLCGVMVGATDGERVVTDVVPVEFFRHDGPNPFKEREYLEAYAELGHRLLQQLGATKETHRIEICSGHVNTRLKEQLSAEGYEVRVVEVRGLLQDKLEDSFRAHVAAQVGRDLYYDAKVANNRVHLYRTAANYGAEHYPHLLKTGWKSLARLR